MLSEELIALFMDEVYLPYDAVRAEYERALEGIEDPLPEDIELAFDTAYQTVLEEMYRPITQTGECANA